MSPDEIAAIHGPVDPVLIAEIAKTGATQEELAQAWIWINADEALINEGRPLPSGRTHCMIRSVVVATRKSLSYTTNLEELTDALAVR